MKRTKRQPDKKPASPAQEVEVVVFEPIIEERRIQIEYTPHVIEERKVLVRVMPEERKEIRLKIIKKRASRSS